MCSVLLITVLLTELCAGQSTPTSATSSVLLTMVSTACVGCHFAVATAAASPDNATTHTGISTVSPTASYIVFTAYSITSVYESEDVCVTTSGVPISVVPPFSVSKPTSIPTSDFEPTASYSFLDYLGIGDCVGQGEQVIPTDLTPVTLVNGSLPRGSLLSANSTSTKASISGSSTVIPAPGSRHQNLDKQAKIGIGIAIPVAVGALVLPALLLWRRYRKNKGVNTTTAEHKGPEGVQPYLQQKPELEAEDKGKQELDAEERRYELAGASLIHEMSDRSNNSLPASRVLQELRGEEHAKELGVS
ncbi:hypothetical protein BDR22DRAFT_818902 [Usnea florida]